MSLNLAYSFFALFVMLTAIICTLSPAELCRRAFHLPLSLLASLGILFLPIDGAPVYYYLRGYIGDLSITSVLLFGAYVLQKRLDGKIFQAIEVRFLYFAVLCMGVILYPLALGLGQFDPYRLGYHPYSLLALMFMAALYFWYKGYNFLLLVVISAVVGLQLGLLESNNFWDYLLDAVLWLVCIARYLRSGLKALPSLLRR